MVEFILWVIFTKIVSQVVIVKKIVIVEKNWNNWKGIFSSNINEFIKTVLNLLFFFTKRFYTHRKHKKHKKHQKAQKAPKSTKTMKTHPSKSNKRKWAGKNKKCTWKHLRGKKSLIYVWCLQRKNKKVSTMEMLIPLN